MLGRLFKYDMKSVAKLVLPLSLMAFAISLLGTLALKLVLNTDADSAVALQSVAMFVFVVSVISLCVYPVLCWFSVLQRFYKNLYTDEGYLTFTLPVKTWQILLSKLLTAILWTIIAVVVLMACISFIFTFSGKALVNFEWFKVFLDAIRQTLESDSALSIKTLVLLIVTFAVSLVYSYCMIFFAITVGSIICHKHKILAAIGIYYGSSVVISIVLGIVNLIAASGKIMGASLTEYANTSSLINILVSITFGAIAFILCNYFVKNKLNLE